MYTYDGSNTGKQVGRQNPALQRIQSWLAIAVAVEKLVVRQQLDLTFRFTFEVGVTSRNNENSRKNARDFWPLRAPIKGYLYITKPRERVINIALAMSSVQSCEWKPFRERKGDVGNDIRLAVSKGTFW